MNVSIIKTLETNRILGDGSYGCVIQPPIQGPYEKVYIQYENPEYDDVGKLFKYTDDSKEEFMNELNLLLSIKQLDPQNEFTVGIKGANSFLSSTIMQTNIIQCIESLNDNYNDINYIIYQIIEQNGGRVITDIPKYSIPFVTFLKLLRTFLLGMQKLHSNKIVHRDIKPDNVLYSPSKISLIDFGLSEDARDVYSKKSIHILKYYYLYYPLEFYIAYNLITYKNNKSEFKASLEIVIQSIGDYIQKLFKRSKHYCVRESLQDFINVIKLNDMSFNDVFNEDLAYKTDVYSLSFVFKSFANKIIYENDAQKIVIYNMYKMAAEINPFKRASISDLIAYLDSFLQQLPYRGGKYKRYRLQFPDMYNSDVCVKSIQCKKYNLPKVYKHSKQYKIQK